MNFALAFGILAGALAIGDMVSTKSKGNFPSIFISSIVMLIGFWTIIPNTVFEDAGLKSVYPLAVYMLITHLGTLMNFQDMKKQWKTIIIALVSVASIIALVFGIGQFLLGREMAIAGAPPLTGGLVAAIIMQDAANAINRPDVALLALVVYIVQSFAALPLTAFLLKKEARVIQTKIKSGTFVSKDKSAVIEERKKLIPQFPDKYKSTSFMLAKLAFVTFLALQVHELLKPFVNIHGAVLALVFGVIATEIGFLDPKSLNKANSFGFFITVMLAKAISGLGQATPHMLAQVIVPVVIIIILGIIGILLLAPLVGKFLGVSRHMSIAIGLTALLGFPKTYILSEESAKGVADNDEEFQLIFDDILPNMLVGGFVTVTISSVLIAGIMSQML